MQKKLYLYNTASRQKEIFQPVHPHVGMYCCGPTVYNYAHLGNLRTYIFEDVLKRLLRSLGYPVKHIINITDVGHLTSDEDTGDDKMEKGSVREGKTVWDIASFYTDAFKRNIADLNIVSPDVWPKATDHIAHMIGMVQELERRGFTYRTGDGVYFDTSKLPSYSDFARLDAQNLKAGSRVEMGEKRSVTDFALWKFSPTDKKRQMEWDSPWGTGFPGWHIECSAMSLAYLPQPIDIHCGGIDHIRVHHTNEIAQAEAATGKPFCRFWLHGEFLVLDKEKMAKSGDNFITLDSVKQKGLPPLSYRAFCFSAHYRSPLVFSWDGLKAAAQGLDNLKQLVETETKKPLHDGETPPESIDSILAPFRDAVCDDCNIPVAMASVWSLLKEKQFSAQEKYMAVEKADGVLGLKLLEKDSQPLSVKEYGDDGLRIKIVTRSDLDPETERQIIATVRKRKNAKLEKDFSTADALRMELKRMGVELKDIPGGVVECTMR